MGCPETALMSLTTTFTQANALLSVTCCLTPYLRDRPSHPGTNTALGLALKDQDKLDEAAAAFQRVVAVAPDQARAYSASAADGRCLRRVRSSADRSRIGAPQQLAKCAIRARCSRVELKAE
jgi:Flp pilus assembly protein TadD